MKLSQANADIYIPDNCPTEKALSRVTHLAVGAHQDDLEFMAWAPIKECFRHAEQWFAGITVTDGSGSPRSGPYASITDEEMITIRRAEQKKAALIGEYAVQIQLDHPSKHVKSPNNLVQEDLTEIFNSTQPSMVYTHNLADKHDSHVGVTLHVIQALRNLPPKLQPQQLIGCEVWRDLDWQHDKDKVVMSLDGHENLADALMGVYDSQIAGGKQYDQATRGRRRAHATYFASHGVDEHKLISFGMNLTPLLHQKNINPLDYIQTLIGNFQNEVLERIKKLS